MQVKQVPAQSTMMRSMTMFARLFIDTGGFIALADRSDVYHSQATEFYRSLKPHVKRLTSLLVVSEAYTWLLYHINSAVAGKWLGFMEEAEEQGVLSVLYPDQKLERKARRLLHRYSDQQLSYTDAVTLAILQEYPEIDAIFSFDRHMALAGILVVPGPVG